MMRVTGTLDGDRVELERRDDGSIIGSTSLLVLIAQMAEREIRVSAQPFGDGPAGMESDTQIAMTCAHVLSDFKVDGIDMDLDEDDEPLDLQEPVVY